MSFVWTFPDAFSLSLSYSRFFSSFFIIIAVIMVLALIWVEYNNKAKKPVIEVYDKHNNYSFGYAEHP